MTKSESTEPRRSGHSFGIRALEFLRHSGLIINRSILSPENWVNCPPVSIRTPARPFWSSVSLALGVMETLQ